MGNRERSDTAGQGGSADGGSGKGGRGRGGEGRPPPGLRLQQVSIRPRRRARRGRGWLEAGAILIAVLLVAVAALDGRSRPLPEELVLEPRLLAKLQTLSDGLHKEIVLCLTGRAGGDTAVATGFTMPAPRLSTPTRSSFDACPAHTLASWHNHPRTPSVSRPGDTRGGWDGGRASRWLCVLSDTDIGTARRLGHPFIVVSVDATTWCWWSLSEVEQFARQAIAPAPPAPERLAQEETPSFWALPEE